MTSKESMTSYCNSRRSHSTFVLALLLFGNTIIAVAQASTFEISISSPLTMHAGKELIVDTITSNRTDHIIWMGSGCFVGMGIELVDNKGNDIGKQAMGDDTTSLCDKNSGIVLNSSKVSLRPQSIQSFRLRYRPEPGSLPPGAYKLRVHRRDASSNIEVFSNTVVIAVLP